MDKRKGALLMDKRIRVTPDELAIIEGLRHEKAIWNAALAEAVLVVQQTGGLSGEVIDDVIKHLMELRKL